jgi:thiamine-phosphate pyrophosphorylase
MFNKLQYISQGKHEEQTRNIHQALDGGCKWVQLRYKNQFSYLYEEYLADFIINDNVYLAQQIAADGVHLGLTRCQSKKHAAFWESHHRSYCKQQLLILKITHKGCDYIGLGPFRFTTTKKNLSPILGLEGYQTILNEMKTKGLQFQYAIGGIEMTFLH